MRQGLAQGREVLPLAIATQNHEQLLPGLEPAAQTIQRRYAGAYIGALAVVDISHALFAGDRLQAMRLARIVGQRPQRRAQRQVNRRDQSQSSQRIAQIVSPLYAQAFSGHQAGQGNLWVLVFLRRCAAQSGNALHQPSNVACTFIQTKVQMPARQIEAVADFVFIHNATGKCKFALLAVHHGDGAGREYFQLVSDVLLHVHMPVEVVLRDVQNHRRARRKMLRIMQLKARQLQHPNIGQAVALHAAAQSVEQTWADIACQFHPLTGALRQQSREAGNGGFAIGARNGQHFRAIGIERIEFAQAAREQLQLAQHFYALIDRRLAQTGGTRRADAGAGANQSHTRL